MFICSSKLLTTTPDIYQCITQCTHKTDLPDELTFKGAVCVLTQCSFSSPGVQESCFAHLLVNRMSGKVAVKTKHIVEICCVLYFQM